MLCSLCLLQAQAIRKLTYLQMIGCDMSWAAFGVIEVMTASRFGHKRMGYLAANQTFTEETEVVLLTTNYLRKEFTSSSQVTATAAVQYYFLAGCALPGCTMLQTHTDSRWLLMSVCFNIVPFYSTTLGLLSTAWPISLLQT